jgi:hypothetical protein
MWIVLSNVNDIQFDCGVMFDRGDMGCGVIATCGNWLKGSALPGVVKTGASQSMSLVWTNTSG